MSFLLPCQTCYQNIGLISCLTCHGVYCSEECRDKSRKCPYKETPLSSDDKMVIYKILNYLALKSNDIAEERLKIGASVVCFKEINKHSIISVKDIPKMLELYTTKPDNKRKEDMINDADVINMLTITSPLIKSAFFNDLMVLEDPKTSKRRTFTQLVKEKKMLDHFNKKKPQNINEETKAVVITKVCCVCNLNQYCSKECQKKDWPEHKKVCKKISKATKFEEQLLIDMKTYMKATVENKYKIKLEKGPVFFVLSEENAYLAYIKQKKESLKIPPFDFDAVPLEEFLKMISKKFTDQEIKDFSFSNCIPYTTSAIKNRVHITTMLYMPGKNND